MPIEVVNMNEEMCYITYVVPKSSLPPLAVAEAKVVESEERGIYPEGFMPNWFLNGSFPEDDF